MQQEKQKRWDRNILTNESNVFDKNSNARRKVRKTDYNQRRSNGEFQKDR